MSDIISIENILFKFNYMTVNKGNINIYSWIYYNKNNDLCKLIHEKGNIPTKDKLTQTNTYYVKLIDKHSLRRIHLNEIENEIEYINISNILFNRSANAVKYISNEIGSNYSITVFEYMWLIKNNDKNYFKLTIDMYKFIITLTFYDIECKEIIVSIKKLKIFLSLNKSKILYVIKQYDKIYKVNIEKNKKLNFEEKKKLNFEEKKKLEFQRNYNVITSHDATRKVGSKVKTSQIYIIRSLQERYETQAQKPFNTKYPWDIELTELN